MMGSIPAGYPAGIFFGKVFLPGGFRGIMTARGEGYDLYSKDENGTEIML